MQQQAFWKLLSVKLLCWKKKGEVSLGLKVNQKQTFPGLLSFAAGGLDGFPSVLGARFCRAAHVKFPAAGARLSKALNASGPSWTSVQTGACRQILRIGLLWRCNEIQEIATSACTPRKSPAAAVEVDAKSLKLEVTATQHGWRPSVTCSRLSGGNASRWKPVQIVRVRVPASLLQSLGLHRPAANTFRIQRHLDLHRVFDPPARRNRG